MWERIPACEGVTENVAKQGGMTAGAVGMSKTRNDRMESLRSFGGDDETRTRDPRRDRPIL